MKLWLDGQCFQSSSRRRGIGRYALAWIRALAGEGAELVLSLNAAVPDDLEAIEDALLRDVPGLEIRHWHGIAEAGLAFTGATERRRVSERVLDLHVGMIAPDAAICLSPFEAMSHPFVPFRPGPAFARPGFAIIYDFIPHRMPDDYLRTAKDREAYGALVAGLRAFDGFLAISAFAAEETRAILGAEAVTNLSAGIAPDWLAGTIRPRQPASPFTILYVGALDPRKNVGVCLDALQRVRQQGGPAFRFEVHGAYSPGEGEALLSQARRLGLAEEELVLAGSFRDEDLVSIYRRADLVIQPSLMEGFGLTALEAMASGVPVLAARAGALPEVVGLDEALFDPRDPEDLAGRILALMRDPDLRERLARHGLARAADFTWARSAREGLAAIGGIAARKPATKPAPVSQQAEEDALFEAVVAEAETLSRGSLSRLLALNAPKGAGSG
ncbi:MAG: glycosyltransferase family 1 protein [Beijerinckiaceae bacterium]|nr:glycosyltransferase family 1 protein [Beijerinckiaceae bacterium]MCZ8298725.1 glycosyltransferase family 1 protein [Beijerinckiaceae bacterium]